MKLEDIGPGMKIKIPTRRGGKSIDNTRYAHRSLVKLIRNNTIGYSIVQKVEIANTDYPVKVWLDPQNDEQISKGWYFQPGDIEPYEQVSQFEVGDKVIIDGSDPTSVPTDILSQLSRSYPLIPLPDYFVIQSLGSEKSLMVLLEWTQNHNRTFHAPLNSLLHYSKPDDRSVIELRNYPAIVHSQNVLDNSIEVGDTVRFYHQKGNIFLMGILSRIDSIEAVIKVLDTGYGERYYITPIKTGKITLLKKGKSNKQKETKDEKDKQQPCKIQGNDHAQISRGSIIRGVGLRGGNSQISLGYHNSNN